MKDFMLDTFYKQRAEFEKSTADREKSLVFPENAIEHRDVYYVNDDDKAHRLDIFRPKGRDGEVLPVIVDVHGGGMILGNKEFNRYFCARIASLGYLVFSIEFRLVPEVHVYEQFADISAAMDFIKEVLVQYCGDPEHVYAAADSADGFSFVSTAPYFAASSCIGQHVSIKIKDFALPDQSILEARIIRSSNNSGAHIVGCQMPQDNYVIMQYIEKQLETM